MVQCHPHPHTYILVDFFNVNWLIVPILLSVPYIIILFTIIFCLFSGQYLFVVVALATTDACSKSTALTSKTGEFKCSPSLFQVSRAGNFEIERSMSPVLLCSHTHLQENSIACTSNH